MRYLIILVFSLQGCALVPHMLAAAPGIRLDDKPKNVITSVNARDNGDSRRPIKPAHHTDPCYRYVDPHVENPGAMRLGCEEYTKKYKGKVQR